MALKTAKPKKPNGRPRAEFSQATFESLCSIQCTLSEIAGVMRVSEDTVERRCKEHYGETFAEIYKKLSAVGKSSLRRTQFKMAERNTAMAIWLGKQYLGQSDKQEWSTKDGRPLTTERVREMSPQEAYEYAKEHGLI